MKKYTDDAQKALQQAEMLSLYTGNIVESIHLLIGITEISYSYGAEILSRLGFDSSIAKSYLIHTSLTPASSKTIVGPTAAQIIEYADIVSKATNNIIDTHHLLLAISYHKSCTASKILNKNNITYEKLLGIVEGMNHNRIGLNLTNQVPHDNNIQKNQEIDIKNHDSISRYGVDLTEKAINKQLDKIIGREKEIDRIIRILSRKRKNNPIIVGESGVGKTAIVEALAQKIAENSVPDFLKGKSIFSLNVNSIVSGTKYRGEMEEKIEEVFNYAREHDIILFIDEIHAVINAGNSENGGSVGSILKPLLSNERLKIIGATTFNEYSKYLEKDSAFERRFMKVIADEPNVSEATEILRGIKESFENHYKIKIDDGAIESAVNLSVRYLTNRFLPDKAIDLLDEASSKVSLDTHKKNVTSSDIKETLTELTGIPISDFSENNYQILNLESDLKKRIIGQEEALHVISKSIMRSKAGLRDGKKPIGSFLFLGTSGSGKTETAKVLATILFGSADSLIRFDMSEYMEKNAVARLIGAPPGYVGYEEGGKLTESVKNKPYSIILFDEIEKANPDIFNILLQVLDDGRLTDGRGRTTDFRNTIIIMTSNAGTTLLGKAKPVGFGSKNVSDDEKDIQIRALKSIMKPEFINRIDNIVVYNRLTKENLREIAEYILEEKKRIVLNERGIKLTFSPEVADYIAENSMEADYGARPIRITIESMLENELSEVILEKNLKDTELTVNIENGKAVIFVKQ